MVLVAWLPAAADAKKGPVDKQSPDLEKLISEAVGKAVEKAFKEIYEKHGLQADEQRLLTSADRFAPKRFKRFNRLTISVIKPGKATDNQGNAFELKAEIGDLKLRFNRFYCDIPRPIAILSYGMVQGNDMATREVMVVYDKKKGAWEPSGK
jgi:hypothetical protein